MNDLCKKIQLLLVVISVSFYTSAQTNIWGVVNTYHKIVQVIPAKACVRVASTVGLDVNSRVMIVQMKGATMQTANNSTYGDTISLNNAGNYEIGTVCYIIGDSVFLFHNLLNSYDSAGKAQLVQFGEYQSAIVTDTVKAQSWDSAAGTGGVIAIFADDDLILNAPIYADSSGNAGGIWFNNASACPPGTGYAYDINTASTTDNGGYKGEGVANIPSTVNSAKGAPVNGGGGGNNHNNSGGGGANLKVGGDGGGNSSSAPFSCVFLAAGNNGKKGKALNSWGDKKIFMGGGGGAGHSNNGNPALVYGGNGGGLIFIWANNIIGNGFSISARGGKGGDSQADGAGGGGAGGTIIMNVASYTGPATISATGGNGGNSFNDISTQRCFGGGGGGSGGAIYFSGLSPSPGVTVSVAPGSGGIEFDRHGSCNAALPGASGLIGDVVQSYTFSRSTSPAGYCLLLLPTKLIYFNAQLLGDKVGLTWEVEHPELADHFVIEKKVGNNWIVVATVNAMDTRFQYSGSDAVPGWGNNFYRLKVIEKDNSFYYSPIRRIWNGQGISDFTLYPNPSSGKVYISGNFQTGDQIRLLDISGKLIWQQKITGRTEIQLPLLAAGIYVVQHGNTSKKLVIH